jgi:antitoxin VapB
MPRTAKLLRRGRSQAVLLPSEFRFEGAEVFIRRDYSTGDVILSRRPGSWEYFFAIAQETGVSDDFMSERGEDPPQKRALK